VAPELRMKPIDAGKEIKKRQPDLKIQFNGL